MKKICSILLLFTLLFSFPAMSVTTLSATAITQEEVLYEATFLHGDEHFTAEGPVTQRPVWSHSADGFMNADAAYLVQKMTTFYLVSPRITLSDVGNSVSFEEIGSYFKDNWKAEAQLAIREVDGEWVVIDREYPSADLTQVTRTEKIYIPEQYDGKTVQIAFKYTSDGHTHSGIWHVRNLEVKSCPVKQKEAELAFANGYFKRYLTATDDFVAPELSNPHQLAVTYSSSREDVAAVDPVSGKITILAEGKTKITARSTANEEFKAGEASYVIDVYDAPDSEFARPETRSPIVAVEFTGQRCRYCPNMSRGLESNQERYGKENFIIAALHHLTEYSLLPPKMVSLYHEEAMHYAKSMKLHEGLPFMEYNTLGTYMSDLTLEEQFKEADLLECTGGVSYTTEGEYVIHLQTRLRRDQQGKAKRVDLLFWALENGIVAFQDDNGSQTYPEHHHIFRGSVNTTWGEPYEIGKAYQARWKVPSEVGEIKNTEIVALFLDPVTKTIVDAACFNALPEEATGVGPVVAVGPQDGKIYDLSGRMVRVPLRAGVYVKNGRKFVVK